MSGAKVPPLTDHAYQALKGKPLREMTSTEHAQVAVLNGCQKRPIYTSNIDGSKVAGTCGATRWSDCTYCASLYAEDVRHLMHVGATAKGREHAYDVIFLTLTAPSFGLVHTAAAFSFEDELFDGGQKRLTEDDKRCGCKKLHRPKEGLQGCPRFPAKYDYVGQVRFNANLSGLWDAFLKSLNKKLKRNGMVGTAPFVRVLELQSRLALHVHAVLLVPRYVVEAMGGEEGFKKELEDSATVGYNPRDGGAPIHWGKQKKTIVHQALDPDASDEEKTKWLSQRSGMLKYLAKYASKGLGVNHSKLSWPQKAHLKRLADVARRMVSAEKQEALSRIDEDDPDRVLKEARVHWKYYRIAESGGCRARVFTKNRAWTTETLQDRRSDRAKHRVEEASSEASDDVAVPEPSEEVESTVEDSIPQGFLLNAATGELIPRWEMTGSVRLPTIETIRIFDGYSPEQRQRILSPEPLPTMTLTEKSKCREEWLQRRAENRVHGSVEKPARSSGRRQPGNRSKVST